MADKPLPATFIIAAIVLALLGVIHIFKLYPIATDNFSIFLVSLFVALMLLPMLKYLKFFNLVELRKSYKALEKRK